MALYAVFREGVYRHECGGIFDTLDCAIATADALAAGDKDSHHRYSVVPFDLNESVSTEPADFDSPKICEAPEVYNVRKKDMPQTELEKVMTKALTYPPGEPYTDFDENRYRK